MFKRISLLATLVVSIFALSGCYVGTYSGSTRTATVVTTNANVARIAYYGPHPVNDVYGDSDWCNISGVHYHAYSPDTTDFYVVDSGNYVFVGDPSYYVSNITFDTYYYMGVHPLPYGNNWCYINGPHRHHWASSGYYNYTRVGSYNYYTYYGARNSYYDPGHIHYDLHSYYDAHPPVRYNNTGRYSVGMRDPGPAYGRAGNGYANSNYNANTGNNDSRTVYRPSTNSSSVAHPANNSNNYNSNVARPANSSNYYNNNSYNNNSARPSMNGGNNNSVRPSMNGGSSNNSSVRPSVSGGSNNNSSVRPSVSGGSNNNSSVRPSVSGGSNNNSVRPSTNDNSAFVRPSTNSNSGSSFTRPSTNSNSGSSFTRPSTNSNSGSSFTRPSTSSNSNSSFTRPSTSSNSNSAFVRPSTSSNSNSSYTRPSTSSNSSSSFTRPSTSSNSSSSFTRPSTSSSSGRGRIDAPAGKRQYVDEDDNSSSGSSSAPSRSASPSRSNGSTGRRR